MESSYLSSPRVYWRSNEDTGFGPGREGGREGANRDTTGEIGEKIVTDILLHRD